MTVLEREEWIWNMEHSGYHDHFNVPVLLSLINYQFIQFIVPPVWVAWDHLRQVPLHPLRASFHTLAGECRQKKRNRKWTQWTGGYNGYGGVHENTPGKVENITIKLLKKGSFTNRCSLNLYIAYFFLRTLSLLFDWLLVERSSSPNATWCKRELCDHLPIPNASDRPVFLWSSLWGIRRTWKFNRDDGTSIMFNCSTDIKNSWCSNTAKKTCLHSSYPENPTLYFKVHFWGTYILGPSSSDEPKAWSPRRG